MNRRWLYWGLPIVGAFIGSVRTILMFKRKEDAVDCFNNQLDAFIGGVIWYVVSAVLLIIKRTM